MDRRKAFTAVALAGVGVAATQRSEATPVEGTSTLAQIKSSGVLRVGVLVGQEPYFHKDLVTGQWSGGRIDMANDIAKTLGVKLQYVESTWGNQILDLEGNKVDLAFAVNPTPQRSLVIDFSTPLLVHSFTVIVRNGFPKPQLWDDINKPSGISRWILARPTISSPGVTVRTRRSSGSIPGTTRSSRSQPGAPIATSHSPCSQSRP